MPGRQNKRQPAGYTLLELIVVVVIVGILATQVVFMLSSATSRVKGAAFNMRNDFNLARSEAVSHNQDVLVDFVFDSGGRDGYSLCVDGGENEPLTPDGSCGDADDTSIKAVLLDSRVQFYAAPPLPADGPAVSPGGASLNPEDGVIFGGSNSFSMKRDGTAFPAGTVVVYVPASGNPAVIKGTPYSVVVGSTTGRVRLMRWNLSTGAWGTK